jgi:hypothetical protein
MLRKPRSGCLEAWAQAKCSIPPFEMRSSRQLLCLRHPDQGPKGRVEGPLLFGTRSCMGHLEKRSLDYAALRAAPLGMTG